MSMRLSDTVSKKSSCHNRLKRGFLVSVVEAVAFREQVLQYSGADREDLIELHNEYSLNWDLDLS